VNEKRGRVEGPPLPAVELCRNGKQSTGNTMMSAPRYKFLRAVFALLLAIGAGANATRAAAIGPNPCQLIRVIGNSIVPLLNGQSSDYAARKEAFRAIYRANFDNIGIVAAVAGPGYRQASPEQRRQLDAAFEDYIVAIYSTQLARYYTGEKLLVLRSETDGDVAVVISVLLPRDSRAEATEIKWRLVNVAGSLRIRDVVIDRISISLSLRREFASLSRQQDSDVDTLIAALRRKTSEAESERAGSHPPARAIRAGR